jgi:magnesium chelatase family protein
MYDLFDLKIVVPVMDVAQCLASPPGEASSVGRERVVIARGRQLARSPNRKGRTNSELAAEELEQVLDAAGRRLLAQLAERLRLSPERVLRVARTIADLEGSDAILAPHVAEALQVHLFGTSG